MTMIMDHSLLWLLGTLLLATASALLLVGKRYVELKTAHVTLEERHKAEVSAFAEKVRLLESAKAQLSDAFKALSADALHQNNQAFLDLAQTVLAKFHSQAAGNLKERETAVQNLVEPLHKTLGTMQTKIEDLEKSRVGAYEAMRQQISSLIETQRSLKDETLQLSQALKSNAIRGRWGEMQLRRVVELAGLSDHCDFTEQQTLKSEEDGYSRPDMIVHLPGKKSLIVDSKVPLSSYLAALEAKDKTERQHHLQHHARQLKTHVAQLAKRQYWNSLNETITPEFTIMFLPADTFLSAALEMDPSILEESIQKRVIITTPPTLIALLHAVAYSWRQESLADNARQISHLGAELYKRMSDMTSHMSKLGSNLDSAVQSYNKTVGSIEARVLPTARKFKDLQVVTGAHEIASPSLIDTQSRGFVSAEMKAVGQDEEKMLVSNKK